MARKKEHQSKLFKLTKEIMVLAEAIDQMDKNMQSTWTDEIEMADLQNLKERMKIVEASLCSLRGEIEHLEELHCKST
jgi:hypothetical protein